MSAKATYILYARSGREVQVADELRLEGIDVWCGLVLEAKPSRKRSGRDRRKQIDWIERPALPNYLFAQMSQHDFHDKWMPATSRLKYVSATTTLVSYSAERDLQRFKDKVNHEFQKARTAKERGDEPPPVFQAGEYLEAVCGPLAGIAARFRRVVREAEGFAIEVDGPLGPIRLNPRDVRKAG